MADTPKHSVSVAGIVVNDQDRVLIVKRRDNGHWEPPGGVLELHETPQQGACREILEETGVVAEAINLSGVYKNLKRGVVALVFRCRPLRGIGSPTAEATDVRWVSLEEAIELMDPAYWIRMKDAFSSIVPARSHDGLTVVNDSGVSQ